MCSQYNGIPVESAKHSPMQNPEILHGVWIAPPGDAEWNDGLNMRESVYKWDKAIDKEVQRMASEEKLRGQVKREKAVFDSQLAQALAARSPHAMRRRIDMVSDAYMSIHAALLELERLQKVRRN